MQPTVQFQQTNLISKTQAFNTSRKMCNKAVGVWGKKKK